MLLGAVEDPAQLGLDLGRRRAARRARRSSSAKIHGLPSDPRAIITASAPGLARRRRRASSAVRRPPETITGTRVPSRSSAATSSRDERVVGPAAVALARRRAGAGSTAATPGLGDQAPGELDAGAVAGLACPDRSFTVTGRPEPSRAALRDGDRELVVAEQGGAGARLQDLRHRAAHVEVDQRRARRAATVAAASRITSGSEPKSWIETGPSSGWMRSISVDRAAVAVGDREARDHLGDRQPGAVAAAPAGARTSCRSRRAARAAPGWATLDVRDAERRSVRAAGWLAHWFRSQISRRPVSVSSSSTSSIVSQNGTIACARPPVAISVGSPPSSASIRRAMPVDQPGEAEDHAGLDRAAGGLADRRLGLGELDPRDPRAALGRAP